MRYTTYVVLAVCLTASTTAIAQSREAVIVIHVPATAKSVRCSGSVVMNGQQVAALEAVTNETVIRVPSTSGAMTLSSSDCWSPGAILDSGDRRASLDVWPAARARAKAIGEHGKKLDTMTFSLLSLGDKKTKRLILDQEIAPSGADSSSRAYSLPAAIVDLRIGAPGRVPKYLFGVDLRQKRETDLGTVVLPEGRSISGWVSGPERGEDTKETTVYAVPSGAAIDTRGLSRLAIGVKTNARGFFQLTGIASGSYTLIVKRSGYSDARLEVTLADKTTEYSLHREIVLDPLADLRLTYLPPTARDRTPWMLQLERVLEPSRNRVIVAKEPIPVTGYWSKSNLQTGKYWASLLDAQGSVRARKQFVVDASGATEHLEVTYVSVKGTVSRRGTPSVADVLFTWTDGSTIRIPTDDHGQYEGDLSHEGEWRVAIRQRESGVVLRQPNISVHRKDDAPVTLDFSLPSGELHGIVTDESGNAATASVIGSRPHEPVKLSVMSGSDGRFDVSGIEEGEIHLNASNEDGDSGDVAAMVSDSTEPVSLVLRHKTTLSVRVISPGGAPVAGALIRYSAPAWFGRTEETTTGPDGTASLTMPANTAAIDAIVLASGFPIRFASLSKGMSADTVDVPLPAAGGALEYVNGRSYSWPVVRRAGGGPLGLRFLLTPPIGDQYPNVIPTGGFSFNVEPGSYFVCPDLTLSERCGTAEVRAGDRAVIDANRLHQ